MLHSRSILRGVCSGAAGVVLLALLTSPGCGSQATDSSASTESRAGQSEGIEMDVAHCAGFGPSKAAALLGVPAESLEDNSQDLTEHSRWCIYSNKEDSGKGVTFTVDRAESADKAALEFQQFLGHLDVATETIGEAGDKAHKISGLGDEAVWAPIPGGVYLRQGRYSVQVNQPADEETQIKIAHAILGE